MPRRRRGSATSHGRTALADALKDPACYDHDVKQVQVAETHISWVFLTGEYAYKVKKPVKLPFLDFSTLRRRRHFCDEELRLNRRLAPELYLDVVPIGGSPAAPRVGRRPAIEYAVKMRQFDAGARLDRRLQANAVPREAVVEFATRLAKFHTELEPLHGDPSGRAVVDAALDNFDVLEQQVPKSRRRPLGTLRAWTERQCAMLVDMFPGRVAAGAERECHGDLHLENLLWRDGRIMAYDALEFDARLREIDVVSEAAFLAMDLMAHDRRDLAYWFLNGYFEAGGDYDGIDVLRFYLVYRALVRAKVRAIKAAQEHHRRRRHPYFDTALELISPKPPLLLVTYGLSGSGKTHLTEELIGRLPALRVRSDIERKRLHNLDAAKRTKSGLGQGLYTAAATERTYATLASIADRGLRQGFSIIVDATFLQRARREAFRQVAAANQARFAILECTAEESELRRRIVSRAEAGRDASEASLAVLDRQLRVCEPLGPAERRSTLRVDTQQPLRYRDLVAALASR